MITDDTLGSIVDSLPASVEVVGAIVRAVWRCHLEGDPLEDDLTSPSNRREHRLLDAERLTLVLGKELTELAELWDLPSDTLEQVGVRLSWCQHVGNRLRVHRDFFHVPNALRRILPASIRRRPADLKFLALRSLRWRYGVTLSAETVELLQGLARLLNPLLEVEKEPCLQWTAITEAIDNFSVPPPEPRRGRALTWGDFLIELCAIRETAVPAENKSIRFSPESLKSDLLLNHLFGVPTSIRGFDEMFGGGGLMLVDDPNIGQPPPDPGWKTSGGIGGRTVLAIGPFGSGKSSLSLQMAVEVARKGGVAWIMALEQSVEECLVAMQSLGISANDIGFDLVNVVKGDAAKAFDSLGAPEAGRGALVFDAARDLEQAFFFQRVQAKTDWLLKYPLRLLVVDPVNVVLPAAPEALKLRNETKNLFEAAKRKGINIWIACEQVQDRSVEGRFEENIADVVVRLSVERDQAYQLRHIEITKSRLQKEQPGSHVFTLSSQEGLEVHAPTAAYIDATQDSGHGARGEPVPLLIPGLDEIVGHHAVLPGDLIALNGQTGTSKTLFGLLFLRGYDNPAQKESACSLLISDFGEDRMNAWIDLSFGQSLSGEGPFKSREQIEVLRVRPGFTDPGEILRDIRDRLDRIKQKRLEVDRVMITNLSRWELDMPLLKADPTFGVALLSLLRASRITSAIVIGYSSELSDTPLKNVVLESADCVLEFSRLEFRGQDWHFLRALKTHQMTHRRGRFELVVNSKGVSITPMESLLRVDATGNVTAVSISLFLHAETPNHERYNEHIVDALRTTVSSEARIKQEMRRYDTNVLTLGARSAVDEVQILQLDEFQLPQATARAGRLFAFPPKAGRPPIKEHLRRLRDPLLNAYGHLLAVPFYENISLLAYDRTKVPSVPSGWKALAEACEAWESTNNDRDGLYFACQVARSDRLESYNCLFFEILYSLQPPPVGVDCDLYAWLFSEHSRTAEALGYFRKLVRRFHNANFLNPAFRGKRQTEAEWRSNQMEINRRAVVWRHWYNTLNQMLSDLVPDKRADIAVRPLYGPMDDPMSFMTTAGTWFLSVPAYSAAPEVALEIIQFLTTPEKDLQRVHLGVGLPTREQFYCGRASNIPPASIASPYFDLDLSTLSKLVTGEHVFQRSQFHCYELFAELMSSHLVRILELPDHELTSHLDGALESLKHSFEFIRDQGLCGECHESRGLVQLTTGQLPNSHGSRGVDA